MITFTSFKAFRLSCSKKTAFHRNGMALAT
jgi:hypothetical protein